MPPTRRPNLRIPAFLLMLLAATATPAAARASTGEGLASALEPLMAGEFALQAGKFARAAALYAQAARSTSDPVVAERATRIALMADDLPLAERNLALWRRLAPDSIDSIGVALEIDLAARRAGSAAANARALVVREKGWRTLLDLLSRTATDGGGTVRAALQAAVEDPGFPRGIEPGLAFAALARRLGETGLARRLADRLEAAHPADPRVLAAGATLDREAGDAGAARARLDRALALPLDAETRRAIAGELAQLDDAAAAARVLAVGPQDDATYMLRAAWLVEAGDTAGLAALDREIQAGELNPARRLLLGQIAEVRSAWPEAERWYRSVDAGPGRNRARLRIAATLERQGQVGKGADWLRGLQRDGALHGDALRDAYLFEAELWARSGDDHKAQDAFARGLAVFEDDAVLLYARAMQRVRRDRIDAGLADLRRILDRNGDHAEALNAYGYTLAEFKQRYAEALPYVEKSNRLQPGSAATLDSLGWIRLKLGDAERGLSLLREAWGREQDPEIAAHLGEALWLAGERDEARRIWARGLELDADNKALRATMEKFLP